MDISQKVRITQDRLFVAQTDKLCIEPRTTLDFPVYLNHLFIWSWRSNLRSYSWKEKYSTNWDTSVALKLFRNIIHMGEGCRNSNIWCGARCWCQVSSSVSLYLTVLRQGSSLNLELSSNSSELAGLSAPGIFLSLPSQPWDNNCSSLHLAFYVGPGVQIHIFMFVRQSTLLTELYLQPAKFNFEQILLVHWLLGSSKAILWLLASTFCFLWLPRWQFVYNCHFSLSCSYFPSSTQHH